MDISSRAKRFTAPVRKKVACRDGTKPGRKRKLFDLIYNATNQHICTAANR